MSKYNKYAVEFDKIAREAFAEIKEANSRLAAAEQKTKAFPQRNAANADYSAKSAQAQADYFSALQNKNEVLQKVSDGEYTRRIRNLKEELEKAIAESNQVKPEQVDPNALELLKSGVMNAEEYAAMLEKAIASDNVTMARLVGKYAETASQGIAGKYGITDPVAASLRRVAMQAKQNDGKKWIEAFEYMEDVYNRAIRNPYMMCQWDELTAQAVENF